MRSTFRRRGVVLIEHTHDAVSEEGRSLKQRKVWISTVLEDIMSHSEAAKACKNQNAPYVIPILPFYDIYAGLETKEAP